MEKKYSTSPGERVTFCQSCGASDLYLQKKFPRAIALVIIGIGILLTPKTLGISLVIVALIDFVIYQWVPWISVCYRCRCEHHGFKRNPTHKEFDRHIDELYQYGKD